MGKKHYSSEKWYVSQRRKEEEENQKSQRAKREKVEYDDSDLIGDED